MTKLSWPALKPVTDVQWGKRGYPDTYRLIYSRWVYTFKSMMGINVAATNCNLTANFSKVVGNGGTQTASFANAHENSSGVRSGKTGSKITLLPLPFHAHVNILLKKFRRAMRKCGYAQSRWNNIPVWPSSSKIGLRNSFQHHGAFGKKERPEQFLLEYSKKDTGSRTVSGAFNQCKLIVALPDSNIRSVKMPAQMKNSFVTKHNFGSEKFVFRFWKNVRVKRVANISSWVETRSNNWCLHLSNLKWVRTIFAISTAARLIFEQLVLLILLVCEQKALKRHLLSLQ